MDIRQIITDYVRRSVLTTAGDLLVRGAAAPERLAGGAAGTVLVGKGAGVKPVYADKAHKLWSTALETSGVRGIYGVEIINVGDVAYLFAQIPADYLRDAKLEIIYVTVSTGADMHVSIEGNRMAPGETAWTDTWDLVNQDIGATVDTKMYAYDVTAQFSAIRASDIIRIRVHHSATARTTDIEVVGLRTEYVST